MPTRSGKKTGNEKAFARHYALTGDREYAGMKAGYAVPASGASQALQRPAVQAEIARIQMERLFNDALPAAVQCLISIVQDTKAAAGARVQASKVILDRTLGSEDAGKGKEPHEMTAEEIARAIDQLERVAFERAKPLEGKAKPLEGKAEPIDDAGIFA